MPVRWLEGEGDVVLCPACGAHERMPLVLELLVGGAARTLTRCKVCGLRHFPGLEPASYAGWDERAAMRGFELGFGLLASIECLPRIAGAPVRRFLEVGCGTAYTSDYVRRLYGWEVLGLDASAWARAAGEQLGVPVQDALMGGADVGTGAWDLVFACEVIEHVVDPVAFAVDARRALDGGGIFLLRTPDGSGISPQLDEARLAEMLSPGYHTMLHTTESIERALRAAGFAHVRTLAEGFSVHAAASDEPFDWSPEASLDAPEFECYLAERAETLPVDSPARLGLLQQLAYRLEAAGDERRLAAELARVGDALRARYGVGLDVDAASLPAGAEELYCHALSAVARARLRTGEEEAATAAFAVAAEAGRRALAGRGELGAVDLGLRYAARAAELEAAVRTRDAGAFARLLGGPAPDRELLLEAVFRTVAGGAPELAAPYAAAADEALAQPTPHDVPLARQAAWAVAMVRLVVDGDLSDAAERFGALAGDPGLEPSLSWSARFHAGYAAARLGERAAARPHLRAVVDASGSAGGPPAEFVERARALLDDAADDEPDVAAGEPDGAVDAPEVTRRGRSLLRRLARRA